MSRRTIAYDPTLGTILAIKDEAGEWLPEAPPPGAPRVEVEVGHITEQMLLKGILVYREGRLWPLNGRA